MYDVELLNGEIHGNKQRGRLFEVPLDLSTRSHFIDCALGPNCTALRYRVNGRLIRRNRTPSNRFSLLFPFVCLDSQPGEE